MSIITDVLSSAVESDKALERFDTYYRLLIEWNEKINLTAITEEREAATKHFLDCISIFKSGLIGRGDKIIDVGTGAGFPGLPLKIYDESLNVTLMDSLNKRINFLNEVISELGLSGIETVHSRAEDLGKNPSFREGYDLAVSRAVANLASLSELCLPFVKVGGYFISMKGPKAQEEIEQARKAIAAIGGEYVKTYEYSLEGSDASHNLVIIKKVAPTSKKYPRNAPKPVKEPIV